MTRYIFTVILTGLAATALADNPLVTHLYTADPTARVFGDRLYVYPSHDIDEHNGLSGNNNFMMADYHVFSTTDLINFTDHGKILDQKDVDWVDDNSYAMWAPDCIEYNGKYYFYFPGDAKIGVAISDHPEGPFTPHQKPIAHTDGKIDPGAFIDDDGTPYLFFGGGKEAGSLLGMRMEKDMITPAMEPIPIMLPTRYKEGSFVFKRNDLYYFTFPHATGRVEDIAYAIGDNPLGPFEYKGVILNGSKEDCWTIHHSIVEYKGQWYIFYHHHDLTKDGTLRAMAADKICFNDDGTIMKTKATRRGIGIRKAHETIQVDRFSDNSGLLSPAFGRTEYGGFYVSGITDGSWLKYPDVDFEQTTFKTLSARIFSPVHSGGTIEVRQGSTTGKILATIPVPKTGQEWSVVTADLQDQATGLQDLVLVFHGPSGTENLFFVDWLRFNTPQTVQVYFEGNGYGTVSADGLEQKIHSYETSALIPLSEIRNINLTAHAEDGSYFLGWKLNEKPASEITSVKPGDRITAIYKQESPQRLLQEGLEAEKFVKAGGVLAIDYVERGRGVGHIQNGDWVMFDNVDFDNGAAGVSARVACGSAGGTIQVYLDNMQGSPVCEMNVGNSGGWQNWTNVTAMARISEGIRNVYFKFTGDGEDLFHINRFKFIPEFNGIGTIEAEDCTDHSGINTESCKEGGRNIGYIENEDYIVFKNVNFSEAASTISARVACDNNGGVLEVRLGSRAAEPVAILQVNQTGGWQNWETLTAPVSLSKGTHDIYTTFKGGAGYLFNLNWIEFQK